MNKPQTLIVLMSPAGGAKSVIADYLINTKEDAVCVKYNKDKTYDQFYQSINNLINGKHKYVIVNDYNVTVEQRTKLFQNLNLNNVYIVGVWIEIPIHLAKEHNKEKDLPCRVMEELIEKQFRYAVSPIEKEPFDDVVYISKNQISSGLGISKSFPKIEDMYKILDKI